MPPRWLHEVADPILARLPDRLVARILPRSASFDPGDLPPLPPVPAGATRLYIAPTNSAGQAWQWARAAERFGHHVEAVTMATRIEGDFDFPVDCPVQVGTAVWSRTWQRRQATYVLDNFSHVIVEAERTLFSRPHTRTPVDEVRMLRESGIRVAMLCHGSDIRLPSRHAALSEHSPFRDGRWDLTPVLEKQVRRNAAVLQAIGAPVFVSTPDLLRDVPDATWLPVVVDPRRWATDAGALRGDRTPVVAHAPSRSAVKGSDLIDPVLRGLEREGLLVYHRVKGVPAAEMPGIYRGADIVLDQFRIGNYGVAACEAMAAGRLVISHVDSEVRARVRQSTGRDLPILEATGTSIEQVLREVISNPSRYIELAGDGVAFVRAVHDGRLSAERLSSFLSP